MIRLVRVFAAISCGILGASCSLFTSLDGLQGSADVLDAALADGSAADSATSDAAARDAQSDAASASLYAQAVVADHPVGYWRFGESSSASLMKDQTGANDGAYTSSAKLGAAGALVNDPDTAVQCDGKHPIGSVVGSALSFVGAAPMSIEFWAMPTLTDGSPRFIVTKETGIDATREGWAALFERNQMNLERIRDGNFDNISTANVPLNVYVHVVLTFDGTTGTAYQNGASAGSVGFSESLVSTTNSVGFAFGGATGFVGSLDEVAIYDYALGGDRVLAHYKIGRGL